ncbi:MULTISPECIES: aldehyde dehydrogenase family protein [Nocardiopsis]|uniref:Aldehyde Dehydrogenase n=1 Tax=Nocardiopsis dassonvillei (strain ATCC 23218 / DSM 43111 / CIP 107115 / JCM 7437 / KCTC 9190 / NBRC 14626 / NCTC 10488 / NRRL B-5397 / IMRU 509) TaxID=446468 RepID=D7B2W3_NOCDD|nr:MULTISPECIES: aldehyde dehydrogenase family protein [Nocardiopsis]ADH68653.1 Aldehyde Dehydrogenase [Nocardiopsis dassonvillei subsp. dassonvillei DSM 43111]APC36719.1 aldehyde dehydrogenase [Nocardiopsis dassonvillei]NKY78555.1 aldehyde dehydrogenase [Nocardiopsis dassonvillei]VEI89162.1 Putative aldehyde dehydrogenase AldA [Nocardiopsis dassonvillei]
MAERRENRKTAKNAARAVKAAKGTAVAAAPARLAVRKTYKLYLGGAFPRSESGRSYPVTSASGQHLANAPLASRKDARDAVAAARKAFGGWSGRTAYNRGQILYRVAEMLEGRRDQFAAQAVAVQGLSRADAERVVDAAVDRWVYYAGWTDKVAQVLGGANPVSGPYYNHSAPEPTGVVAVFAPQNAPLLGLTSVVAPVIATGNTAVVVTSGDAPLAAIDLAEVLATSDLPGGVVNLLTGRVPELGPHLASHADVNALDLTGAGDLAAEFERAAADTLTRVLRPGPGSDGGEEAWLDPDPGTARLKPFLETKTVWHPVGI